MGRRSSKRAGQSGIAEHVAYGGKPDAGAPLQVAYFGVRRSNQPSLQIQMMQIEPMGSDCEIQYNAMILLNKSRIFGSRVRIRPCPPGGIPTRPRATRKAGYLCGFEAIRAPHVHTGPDASNFSRGSGRHASQFLPHGCKRRDRSPPDASPRSTRQIRPPHTLPDPVVTGHRFHQLGERVRRAKRLGQQRIAHDPPDRLPADP